ncbi:MAG: type II secretion system protein GspD [Candidatus Saccharibacteria bacterium]|nr:type II secretion system protein GspD [Rhodoferax sp.]
MSRRTIWLGGASGLLLAAVGLSVAAQGVNGWVPFGASNPSTPQNQPTQSQPLQNQPAQNQPIQNQRAQPYGANVPAGMPGDSPYAQTPAPAAVPALPGRARLINLPRIDNRSIEEVIGGLITRFEVEKGYGAANDEQIRKLPVPAKVVPVGAVLARTDGANTTHLQRFGYLRQVGQLPQLWSFGITVTPAGVGVNPDANQLDEAITSILASRETNEADIAISELKVEVVKLAYVDSESAVSILKSMGINVGGTDIAQRAAQGGQSSQWSGNGSQGMQGTQGFQGGQGFQGAQGMPSDPGAAQRPTAAGRIKNSELPLVIRTPAPNPLDVGLVGAGESYSSGTSTGTNGFTTMLGATNKLATETLSSPTSQLMVMFNPDRPEQLGRIRKLITEVIDTPARQIVIEAMVLEITSNGLEELGLQWNYQEGFNALTLGSLTPGSSINTFALARNTSSPEFIKNFYIKLEALARDGKAEVLARPSVLTLDNRQATIRVGTDIPIATSRDTSSSTDSRVSYSFFYLPTGIQLNVRPRIDNEGKEVSMQIDAAVSATVANLGVQIRSPGAVILAAAPAVSTRRVQTYARIPNSTPLIIGGLISKNTDETIDKTPILGDLPLVGSLFRSKRATGARQEVIIVLTPYIIDQAGGAHYALPKDAPSFDFKQDTDLFRSNIRLRADDIPDTSFIRENNRLLLYRKLVSRIAAGDPKQVEKPPLSLIHGKNIPAEKDLMAGVLGELLRKRYQGVPILPAQMLLFNEREQGELVTTRLDSVLAKLGDGTSADSFFRLHPAKCLAITFVSHRKILLAGNVLGEPEPRMRLVNCKPDRSDWKAVLYELNHNTTDTEFNTILIKDPSDLLLLARAIALKRLMKINGGADALTIDNIVIGRVLGLPEFGPGQVHTLDYVVARNFYLLQHYLREFEDGFEGAMGEIDTLLRSGKFREFFTPEELPAVKR